MPSWAERPLRTASLIFFDLETTALRPDRGGRISEIGVVDRSGVRLAWQSDRSPPSDAAVAGRLPLLVDHLQSGIVVGHNLSFDVRFLTYESRRLSAAELGGLDVRFVDTLGLARSLLDAPDGYQLGSLLDHFDESPDAALHTAVGDALAARTLFWHLVDAGGLETLSDAGVKRLRWNAG